jgi:hypothetical protein
VLGWGVPLIVLSLYTPHHNKHRHTQTHTHKNTYGRTDLERRRVPEEEGREQVEGEAQEEDAYSRPGDGGHGQFGGGREGHL